MEFVDLTIERTMEHRDWDFYRSNYIAGRYSFEDIVRLNNEWRKRIKDQVFFHKEWVEDFMQCVYLDLPVVCELGCWEGNMAFSIMKNFDIGIWYGYDVCSDAIEKANNFTATYDSAKFVGKSMTKQLWEEEWDEQTLDVFISAHTIEHLSQAEAIMLLNWVQQSSCSFAYIEAPLPENGKVWRGGASAHVLNNFGRKHIRNFFTSNKWKVLFENNSGKLDWCIGVRR